jgi:beta-xylosidase
VDAFRPGQLWPDNRGVHINAHGGGILYQNGVYYWFGEHKDDYTNSALVGVNVYASTDLYHWTYRGTALQVEDNPASDITKGCVIERPKVVYNRLTDTYVMWFHLELKGKGYSAARVGLAVSKNVTGPYQFVRSYRPNAGKWPMNMPEADRWASVEEKSMKAWSPEWLEAIRRGLYVRRDFQSGQMSRDMTIFVDEDGKAYHIYASEENLTLQIAELTDDYQGHTGRYIRVAPAGHNEAPAILKKDGVYFLITSGCTGWEPNAARMFRSTCIWGPWEQLDNPWKGDQAYKSYDSHSTCILPVQGMKEAWIFMADRWRPRHPSDGRYCWIPVEFEQGIPVLRWRDSWTLDVFKKPPFSNE